jgi:hypothetical protein
MTIEPGSTDAGPVEARAIATSEATRTAGDVRVNDRASTSPTEAAGVRLGNARCHEDTYGESSDEENLEGFHVSQAFRDEEHHCKARAAAFVLQVPVLAGRTGPAGTAERRVEGQGDASPER